jgi:A/G-specific adenine glycosylase
MELSGLLIKWYQHHKRDLPWRHTHDPYLIWLSEVILQQTRVEQGLPYFNQFAGRYPTVSKLANASTDEVLKMWQGLGYYSRALNMLHTAKAVTALHKGKFPGSYDELISLKGIGPYTAAAISSFAFNEKKAVVDGNVMRVVSRLFGITEPVNSTRGKNSIGQISSQLIPELNPGLHNQAMMELGALVCKPRHPLCDACPLRLYCFASRHGKALEFPVKLSKKPPEERFMNFFFLDQKGYTYIRRRDENGIWKGLYELPNFVSGGNLTAAQAARSREFKALFSSGGRLMLRKVYQVKHQLTHQRIFASFYVVTGEVAVRPRKKHYLKVKQSELHLYAVPRLFDKFLIYHKLHSDK